MKSWDLKRNIRRTSGTGVHGLQTYEEGTESGSLIKVAKAVLPYEEGSRLTNLTSGDLVAWLEFVGSEGNQEKI